MHNATIALASSSSKREIGRERLFIGELQKVGRGEGVGVNSDYRNSLSEAASLTVLN